MDAESKKQYENLINHFTCVRCKKIVMNPLENISSQRLICSRCQAMLKKESSKELFSRGSFGDFGSKEYFNKTYWDSVNDQNKTPIIRREAPNATSADHRDIFFKRRTDPKNFDAWEYLIVTWTVDSTNEHHKDFDIYSTLKDAIEEKNPWKYVNANDRGVGFPRDSSPEHYTASQWNNLDGHGIKDYKYSVYQNIDSIDLNTEFDLLHVNADKWQKPNKFLLSMLENFKFLCPNRNNEEAKCLAIDENGLAYQQASNHLLCC